MICKYEEHLRAQMKLGEFCLVIKLLYNLRKHIQFLSVFKSLEKVGPPNRKYAPAPASISEREIINVIFLNRSRMHHPT